VYTVSLNPLKSKANKQKTGMNSKRKDVSTSLIFLMFYRL